MQDSDKSQGVFNLNWTNLALLSLGAPFWFNMLMTLSNLRPILANKQQKEAEQEAKNP